MQRIRIFEHRRVPKQFLRYVHDKRLDLSKNRKRERECTWEKLILVYVLVDDKYWPHSQKTFFSYSIPKPFFWWVGNISTSASYTSETITENGNYIAIVQKMEMDFELTSSESRVARSTFLPSSKGGNSGPDIAFYIHSSINKSSRYMQ